MSEENLVVEHPIQGVEQELEREFSGLTVGDGFKFGCGFVMAMAIGLLIVLVAMTAFIAIGVFLGVKPPLFG